MSRYLDMSTEAQIHCPVWTSQSFVSKEICTVTLWQDFCGKGNLRKFYWNTVGKKFQIENAFSYTEQEDYSYQCMWTISNCQARRNTWNRLGKFSWKAWSWQNQHHFLTLYIGVALKDTRILWRTTEICSNPGFLLEPK